MTILEAALDYVSKGFPVIPLCWPNPNGIGFCGCGRGHIDKSIGKVPLVEHGLKDATQTQAGVREYWTKWPKANIGIVIPPGYFVLDVDILHNGYESLEKLQEAGELTKTWLITTGSGGQHYWYKTDKEVKNTTRLAGYEGLDIRGVGGYVVAPPSLHRCGLRYEVSPVWDGEITQAPEWLINLCTAKVQMPVSTTSNGSVTEGSRNDTLTRDAGAMRRRGLSEQAIIAALLITNRDKCNPPLPDNEVEIIAKSIGRYAPEINTGKPRFTGGI